MKDRREEKRRGGKRRGVEGKEEKRREERQLREVEKFGGNPQWRKSKEGSNWQIWSGLFREYSLSLSHSYHLHFHLHNSLLSAVSNLNSISFPLRLPIGDSSRVASLSLGSSPTTPTLSRLQNSHLSQLCGICGIWALAPDSWGVFLSFPFSSLMQSLKKGDFAHSFYVFD